MSFYLLPLLIGVVAGLRAMTAPALVAWAAYWGWLELEGTTLAFLSGPWVRWTFAILAVGELVTDQLPTTPSRTLPVPFATRILMGALSGAAIATGQQSALLGGLAAGAIGAVIGTLGGHAVRAQLSRALGRDRPAALLEDIAAVGCALLIGMAAQ